MYIRVVCLVENLIIFQFGLRKMLERNKTFGNKIILLFIFPNKTINIGCEFIKKILSVIAGGVRTLDLVGDDGLRYAVSGIDECQVAAFS